MGLCGERAGPHRDPEKKTPRTDRVRGAVLERFRQVAEGDQLLPISIWRGLASAVFGSVTVRTPSLWLART